MRRGPSLPKPSSGAHSPSGRTGVLPDALWATFSPGRRGAERFFSSGEQGGADRQRADPFSLGEKAARRRRDG